MKQPGTVAPVRRIQPTGWTTLLIGLACLGAAAVLAWFSSVATMQLARVEAGTVSVAIESRLFGLIRVGSQRIDNVRSPSLVRSREAGSRSNTPDRLVFQTAAGPVDRGYAQQLFVRDFPEIRSFFEGELGARASLSSIGRGREKVRFVIAQLAVMFLALVGLVAVWTGGAAIFARDRGPHL